MTSQTPDIPQALVARAQAGDEAALIAVVEWAYPMVRRWALVQTGDPTEADDLTQDVLVQVIRKLGSFEGSSRFSTWLYTVTRNAASDCHRRNKRRRSAKDDPRSHVRLAPDPAEDPSVHAERSELRGVLRLFFDELPERQRQIFDMVELQGLPATDVAELLGIEPVSVRANLFKARRRLRARLLEDYPVLADNLA